VPGDLALLAVFSCGCMKHVKENNIYRTQIRNQPFTVHNFLHFEPVDYLQLLSDRS